MAPIRDNFLDLERHRKQLEDNVQKLSKALDHWRRSKEEYEALRIRLKSLPPLASPRDLTRVREEYEGDLLNEKELVDLFGRNDSKKPEQIISLLTNRLDYVSKNIGTLSKQLEAAENKLAAVTVVSNPDATDEDGLPITEILEELDDDDNVVSYSLRTPGGNQPQLLEALEKAGIIDTPLGSPVPSPQASGHDRDRSPSEDTQPIPPKDTKSQLLPPPKERPAEDPPETKPVVKKKSVAFSEDTKSGGNEVQSDTAKRLEEILQKARDQQSIISEPVLPADESSDDAALREDMIRYNKDTMEYEMAPIVAELRLEEGSNGDDTDYSDYEDDGDDDDEEDQWGRSTTSVIDDDWKRQMLQLKERLSKHTFGENKTTEDDDMVEGIGRISIKEEEKNTSHGDVGEPVAKPSPEDAEPTSEPRKSVRFAQSLDIVEASESALDHVPPKHPDVDPLSDVMERAGSMVKPATTPTARKPSRFRKGRNGGPPTTVSVPTSQGLPAAAELPGDRGQYAPSGPQNQILANSVLEHEPSSEAKEPDEFDANLLQQQVTEEYHKMRNKFIQRQGGFVKEDENPIQPLDEEEGGPKRMSRFRAARLARS
ncbi:Prefoldin subunit-domain-containing protein [Xylariaceae sp. FL0662B]|nr:Prefoldin subunit-domain-containing protein [Xylariaceae sp. FL0662B]